MNQSRSPSPLLRLSTLPGPVVPVVDFIGAGGPSLLRSFTPTPPRSPVPPIPMYLEEIIIHVPFLGAPEMNPPVALPRGPERNPLVAPRPKRLHRRAEVVRNLEVIAETQAMRVEQNAALARLPEILEDLTVRDQSVGQRSRKRGREPAEDALQVEHKARKHHQGLPSDSAGAFSGRSVALSHMLARARQPSRAGRAREEPARVRRMSTRPPVDVEELESRGYGINDLPDDVAQRYRRARTAPQTAEGERRV